MIFDGEKGFVAGFQAAVHKNVTLNDQYFDYTTHSMFQEGDFFGEKVMPIAKHSLILLSIYLQATL